MIHEIANKNSVFLNFLAELRDIHIQKDSMRLGISETKCIDEKIVLASILRAGLPMHQGFLNYFDKAENAFVSAYRKHSTAEDFEVFVEYMAAPKIDGKTLIIIDPMLATGSSMVLVYKALMKQGTPSKIIIASAIAAPESLIFLKKHLPDSISIFVGAVDKELTAQSYIVPGLGDAGDLAYGEKF